MSRIQGGPDWSGEAVLGLLSDLTAAAPMGYALGLHMGFNAAAFVIQTYPQAWSEVYSAEGFAMTDPTIAWGLTQGGVIDWAALEPQDKRGIFARAAGFGLRFGVCCAFTLAGSRSLGSFARGDRPFEAAEIAGLEALFQRLHLATLPGGFLSPEAAAALRALSVRATQGEGKD